MCDLDITKNAFTYTWLGDSDCKQRYKETDKASIACHGDSTSATLAGRIGAGDIGWDGKVLRQCQVRALRDKKKKKEKLSHTSHMTQTIWDPKTYLIKVPISSVVDQLNRHVGTI